MGGVFLNFNDKSLVIFGDNYNFNSFECFDIENEITLLNNLSSNLDLLKYNWDMYIYL